MIESKRERTACGPKAKKMLARARRTKDIEGDRTVSDSMSHDLRRASREGVVKEGRLPREQHNGYIALYPRSSPVEHAYFMTFLR